MAFNPRLLQGQYVAFAKVTTATWKKMQNDDKLKNTLYFVVDGDTDNVGQLYLGETLIADGSGISKAQLSDLSDVQLKAVSSGDVLVYNLDTQTWENVNLSSQIQAQIKVFTGATAEADGSIGLVPQPLKNIDVNHYLRGDGTWADPTSGVDLTTLKTQVTTLVGDDADKSAREIATEVVATVVDGAPEAFDTLKEISAWILEHPAISDITQMQTDISQLKKTVGDATSGLVKQTNDLSTTVQGLQTTVDTHTNNIGDLQAQNTTILKSIEDHTTRITSLEERLTWHQIEEVNN